jgi:hypothetical protein
VGSIIGRHYRLKPRKGEPSWSIRSCWRSASMCTRLRPISDLTALQKPQLSKLSERSKRSLCTLAAPYMLQIALKPRH